MYRVTSASHRGEPDPRTMIGGSPPTLLNARAGESTPPGITRSARCCNARDLLRSKGKRKIYHSARAQNAKPHPLLESDCDSPLGPRALCGRGTEPSFCACCLPYQEPRGAHPPVRTHSERQTFTSCAAASCGRAPAHLSGREQ